MFFGGLTIAIDGFSMVLVLLPSLSMVFDGFGPLVKRCDGFDGSSWSRHNQLTFVCWLLSRRLLDMRSSVVDDLAGRFDSGNLV